MRNTNIYDLPAEHQRNALRNTANVFMLNFLNAVQSIVIISCINHCSLYFSEKRESFQLDLDSLTPPPISLSAPDISTRSIVPFKALRHAVSSTELLHERAMARFYKAVAMKEEQNKKTEQKTPKEQQNNDIPYKNNYERIEDDIIQKYSEVLEEIIVPSPHVKPPEIIIKTDSIEDREYKFNERQYSQDSDVSGNKWQHLSFEEDYTASTVSTDGEYSDDGSLDGDNERHQFLNEEETYNPRDKMARPSPLKETIEEEDEDVSEKEDIKPLPLPDPNFVPKPILKRREEIKATQELTRLKENKKQKLEEKVKRSEKIPILKKITKMPIQKSFQFPKILSKKEPEKVENEKKDTESLKKITKPESVQDSITEEGRTVIDYYGSIVKEYGSNKRPVTPLYLNTEDLKTVAEKQQLEEKKENTETKKKIKVKKQISKNSTELTSKRKTANLDTKKVSVMKKKQPENIAINNNKVSNSIQNQEKQIKPSKTSTQQILLKKTERATIVIPIDYQELEKKAKMNIRSIIDYTVDLCLLLLAFWVYFFKDEKLAIPFLILIIYRQLQETLTFIPEWFRQHTPGWLKKKTS